MPNLDLSGDAQQMAGMKQGRSNVTQTGTSTEDATFESSLRSLLPRLRRFAHTLSRTSFDADDLLQSAVERALRARHQWQPGTRLDSWMYTILRNQWVDLVRGRTRRASREAPLEEAENSSTDGAAEIESKLELKQAMAAMEQLPDEQREVVALVLIEGFAYREGAEMLGLPMGTVASRLVRGRTALVKMLGGEV